MKVSIDDLLGQYMNDKGIFSEMVEPTAEQRKEAIQLVKTAKAAEANNMLFVYASTGDFQTIVIFKGEKIAKRIEGAAAEKALPQFEHDAMKQVSIELF